MRNLGHWARVYTWLDEVEVHLTTASLTQNMETVCSNLLE